jgi:hypothetical protein
MSGDHGFAFRPKDRKSKTLSIYKTWMIISKGESVNNGSQVARGPGTCDELITMETF